MTDTEHATAADTTIAAVTGGAFMVPMLPCGDIDAMADFWTGLGLRVTYRQRRPNPYLALELGRIALHYYVMPEWDPDQSHSTCALVVPDTEPIYDLFAAGLRERFGRLPVSGLPRVTRPRRRANNAGLSGFSLVDPAGNWVRVSRAPTPDTQPSAPDGDVTEWTGTPGAGTIVRALDAAVVQADSHGDPVQARKILGGALRRASGPDDSALPVPELAPALAYLVELCVRTGDEETARSTYARLTALAGGDHAPVDRAALHAALTEARAVLPAP
ncbi:Glyoxalase-like domain-containing protein [Promicromonospora umidemergens]|uniref:VOC family protein n=1 Tax=Promicromonospora umidemergens TaxID=629679 RepID=A0ABP8XC61_9MICO|nr:hypothetical protein [Promicromonospora umidemergens]MCP2281595.1 Glyoxalase-like domain-containing protein [Promicromonospora umidemergens]